MYYFCLPLISLILSVSIFSPFLPSAFTQEFHFKFLIGISAMFQSLAGLIVSSKKMLFGCSVRFLTPAIALLISSHSLSALSFSPFENTQCVWLSSGPAIPSAGRQPSAVPWLILLYDFPAPASPCFLPRFSVMSFHSQHNSFIPGLVQVWASLPQCCILDS